jgi:putative DNA primase/helicase
MRDGEELRPGTLPIEIDGRRMVLDDEDDDCADDDAVVATADAGRVAGVSVDIVPTNDADTDSADAPNAAATLRSVAARLVRLPKLDRELQQKTERERLGVSVAAMKAAIEEALEAEAEAAAREARRANSEQATDPDFSTTHEPDEPDDQVIARLAKLTPLDYARQSDAAAAQLGIKRVAILDRLVSAARGSGHDSNDEGKLQGRPLQMVEPVPWPQPVNGAALMDEVVTHINRHVVLPTGASVAVALWCVHTYLLDAFRHTPRLTVSSSDPDCGKTTLLDIVAQLVFRPLSTSGISGAAFYRTVEHSHPTLLADEGDSYLHENEELRGCFNAGHKRGGQMIKCVGEDFEPRAFDVFGALAIAMIGLPPATVLSRSISIRMRRAAPGDEFEPLTEPAEKALAQLAYKIARWVADNVQAVAQATPDIPGQLVNRRGDNWKPLFLIATALGGDWPERLKKAAAALLAQAASDPQSLGVMALEDIRALFQQRGNPAHLPSADIVIELLKLEERPWGALGKVEKPLSANRLARLLAPYAIAPGTIRVGEKDTPKGYRREQFEDAWRRYLRPLDLARTPVPTAAAAKYPPQGGIQPPQRHNPQNSAGFSEFEPPQTDADVADGKPKKPRDSATCGVVAVQIPPGGDILPDDGSDGVSEEIL